LPILGIALLMWGPQKLPELGKGLAQGIRGFKDVLKPKSRLAAAWGMLVAHAAPSTAATGAADGHIFRAIPAKVRAMTALDSSWTPRACLPPIRPL
jgi:TatA/E family protein of Tat protein translocase